jgi:hypothetical protein
VPPAAQTGGKKVRAELETNRLWVIDDDGSVVIHDYLEWNPSRADVEAKKAADADRKARGRAQSVQPESGRTLRGLLPSRPVRTETDKSVSSRPRKPDPIWDALVPLFGTVAPGTSAHGKRNRAVADLKRNGATPELILHAHDKYPKLFDGASLTDTALAKHYPQLVATYKAPVAPCPECGIGAGYHTAGCEAA